MSKEAISCEYKGREYNTVEHIAKQLNVNKRIVNKAIQKVDMLAVKCPVGSVFDPNWHTVLLYNGDDVQKAVDIVSTPFSSLKHQRLIK